MRKFLKKFLQKVWTLSAKNSEDLLCKVAYIMVQSVVELRPYSKYQLQTARASYARSCMSD